MMLKFNFVWIRITILICFFVLESISVAYSQHIKTLQPNSYNWEVGLNIGLIRYLGDVGTSSDFASRFKNSINVGYGVSLSKQLSPLLGIKGNLLIGPINGETELKTLAGKIDPNGNNTQVVLKSRLIGTSINATVNLSNLFLGTDGNQLINVYCLAGLGLSNFNGKITDKTNPLITYHAFGQNSGAGINGYQIQGIVNLGLGFNFDIGHDFKGSIESVFKFMKDDNLVNNGSNKDVDSYNYTSIGIAYKIPFSKNQQWYCR